jgi:hypothetical protein
MTVGELTEKLSTISPDLKVVIQECADYRSFREVSGFSIGKFIGEDFYKKDNLGEANSVLVE